MKRERRTGPKRRRWTRRDWSGAGGMGQERRWGSTVGNFRAEREARRAGLTGKLGKHPGQGPDPFPPFADVCLPTGARERTTRGRTVPSASGRPVDYLADREGGLEEEENAD
jgi:hypothetical protein